MQCKRKLDKIGGFTQEVYRKSIVLQRKASSSLYIVHLCIYDLKRDQKENEEKKKRNHCIATEAKMKLQIFQASR